MSDNNICPNPLCGREVDPTFIICPYCGKNLQPEQPPIEASVQKNWICGHCGGSNHPQQSQCISCGYKPGFHQVAHEMYSQDNSNNSSKEVTSGIIFSVLSILCCGLFGILGIYYGVLANRKVPGSGTICIVLSSIFMGLQILSTIVILGLNLVSGYNSIP